MADQKKALQITHIELQNFRCFDSFTLDIKEPVVLFEGINGIGKTTLLEALHYVCYLRSFRTHTPRELIRFGQDAFFVKVNVQNLVHGQPFQHEIQVGFSHGKRVVKVDGRSISSYKELMQHIRVISLTEDDLALIKEGPQYRRAFLDHAVLLTNPDYALLIKDFRQVVDNRNALLQQRALNSGIYDVLTEQLWQKSIQVQQARTLALGSLAESVQRVIEAYFDEGVRLSFSYHPKKGPYSSFDSFLSDNPGLKQDELRYGRSLFGAHLDDFVIHFQDKHSRAFASRGQQKLAVLLLKIAQVVSLSDFESGAVFLLDDFMTDFDIDRSRRLIRGLMDLNAQLVLTSPIQGGELFRELADRGAQVQSLT
jgi:DNA replication and repair protein RecF